MFSSAPRNRKRKCRSGKPERSTWDEPAAPRKKSPKRASPQDEVHQLHAKIGAIESFLEKHQMASELQLRMKQENILPPPDRCRRPRGPKAMTMAERRRYMADRNRTGLKFLFLFSLACAIGWWLIFSGL